MVGFAYGDETRRGGGVLRVVVGVVLLGEGVELAFDVCGGGRGAELEDVIVGGRGGCMCGGAARRGAEGCRLGVGVQRKEKEATGAATAKWRGEGEGEGGTCKARGARGARSACPKGSGAGPRKQHGRWGGHCPCMAGTAAAVGETECFVGVSRVETSSGHPTVSVPVCRLA